MILEYKLYQLQIENIKGTQCNGNVTTILYKNYSILHCFELHEYWGYPKGRSPFLFFTMAIARFVIIMKTLCSFIFNLALATIYQAAEMDLLAVIYNPIINYYNFSQLQAAWGSLRNNVNSMLLFSTMH